ncbi:MAG: hypothetical protein ACI9FJ_001026 [Alteromonadaceae bacterium]|jgi:hypothetical protein
MSQPQEVYKENDTFESRLIRYLVTLPDIKGSYDVLAKALSHNTGKEIDGRKVTYLSKGQSYAKKWLIMAMFQLALENGWMPTDLKDWEFIIWTLTGKKQSVLGGDNSQIYNQLADMADKAEIIFENNFSQIRGAYVG